MKPLTEDAVLVCNHELGTVDIVATQTLVTIEGRRLLVEKDPEGRPIAGCPNIGATIKPCTLTLRVQQGYSDFVRISGQQEEALEIYLEYRVRATRRVEQLSFALDLMGEV
jgi:hypothetical protein